MNIVDLVTTIIVVTIVVSLAAALAAYVARRLRRAHRTEPERTGEVGSRYFVRYSPETRSDKRP